MMHPTLDNGYLAFKRLSPAERLDLAAPDDLLRLPSGILLRIVAVDRSTGIVDTRRKNGEAVSGKLGDAHQVFARVEDELRPGMILEWPAFPKHRFASITDVSPLYGVTLRWAKRVEEPRPRQLYPDLGLWYFETSRGGDILYRRERLGRSFSDIDDLPPGLTHGWSLTKLGRPFTLETAGASLDYIKHGDLIYIGTARHDAPNNHVFVISGVDRNRGRLNLIMGREHCAQATPYKGEFWWRPAATDEVRVYKPARTIARKDLLVWKFDHTDLRVRRGDYTEVLEVMEDRVAVTGVTSTPEVLSFDPARWTPVRSRPHGPIYLRRRD